MPTIKPGVIKSYSSATHMASVQITGSLAVWLDAIPVATAIAPVEVIVGRECTVIFHTDDSPADAVVIAVHGGAVPFFTTHIRDADGNTIVHTETLPNDNLVKMTTAGTLRYTIGNASPQHEVVGATRISQGLQVGPNAALAPLASARIATRDDGSPDGVVGVLADLGTLTAPGAGSLIGMAGHAIGKVSPTVAVRGLDFIAGSTARALNDVDNIRVQAITLIGTGLTIVNCHGLLVRTPSNLGFTITNNYGVRVQTMGSTGDNRRPFQDESTANESNNHGNRFLSNTQFASLVGAFGGGRGVVGIANAPQVPVSNPAAGGVLYAEAGALKWRGSAGTVTTIAIA